MTLKGVVSTNSGGSASVSSVIADDTTTNATVYPTWVAGTGTQALKISTTKVSFNPSTGIFAASGFSGPLNGTVGATTPASVAATMVAASGTGLITGILSVGATNSAGDKVAIKADTDKWIGLGVGAGAGSVRLQTYTDNLGANIPLEIQATTILLNGATSTAVSTLAGTGSRAVLADASGVLSAPISDASFKLPLRDLPESYGAQAIMALRPVAWKYKDTYRFGTKDYLGFDAGETALILPEVTGQMYDGAGPLVDTGKKDAKGVAIMRKPAGTYYVSKEDIIPVLVKHNQQMQAQIDALTARLNAAGIK